MVTRFFKILLNTKDHGLRFPPEFIKRHGKNLPKKVTLMAPGGPKQEVELVQYSNGETWLEKGWMGFKEYHSIGFAHFLMFEYDGNSHFNVVIFDTSAVEVEYPLHNVAAKCDDPVAQVPISVDAGSESDDSVVFLKPLSTSKKQNCQDNGGNKGNRRQYSQKEQIQRVVKKKCATLSKSKIRKYQDNGDHRRQCSQENQLQRVVKERCVAYRNAVAFKSNNPFHVAVMQPSYVATIVVLRLPLTFAKKHLPKKYNNLLLVVDGKEWEVRCNKGSLNAKVTLGWKKFVLENDLKVGDVCIFEVIKKSDGNKPKWNVVIFRG